MTRLDGKMQLPRPQAVQADTRGGGNTTYGRLTYACCLLGAELQCDMQRVVPWARAQHKPPDSSGLFQIYIYSRTPQMLFHPASGRWLPLIIIRESFAAAQHIGVNYIVKHSQPPLVPDAYYKVQYQMRMHVGFPNQYFAYPSLQCNANGTIPLTPLPT